MSEIRPLTAVMAYLCVNYPTPDDLSNARLTKLVYLADWETAKRTHSRTMTSIDWVFNHFGPWVPDVLETAKRETWNFKVSSSLNAFGTDKTVISALPSAKKSTVVLSRDDHATLDAVIAHTQSMYFGQFIDYVYGTHPVSDSERYEHLDLIAQARRTNEPALDIGFPGEETSAKATTGLLSISSMAALREAAHDAIADLLGENVPEPAYGELESHLSDPSIDQIESRYDVSVSSSADAALHVEVDVESEIEGFIDKGAELDLFGKRLHVRRFDWNDHVSWVSTTLTLRFELRAISVADDEYECEVLSAELVHSNR